MWQHSERKGRGRGTGTGHTKADGIAVVPGTGWPITKRRGGCIARRGCDVSKQQGLLAMTTAARTRWMRSTGDMHGGVRRCVGNGTSVDGDPAGWT